MSKTKTIKINHTKFKFQKWLKLMKFHFAHIFILLCRWMPGNCYRNFAELGQSLEFSFWISREFGSKSMFVPTRGKLWDRMIASIDEEQEVTVFEFGVAYGNATKWWLSRCKNIEKLYGFDTFTGLPRAWRHFQTGAFSSNGNPPEIADPRVEWIVGEVEKTLTSELLESLTKKNGSKSQCIYLLDLDLYESTKYVLECILPHLQKGDLLYFDEAADLDERRAFLEIFGGENVLPHLIGATPMAMALQIVEN